MKKNSMCSVREYMSAGNKDSKMAALIALMDYFLVLARGLPLILQAEKALEENKPKS